MNNERSKAEEDLRVIRSLMERATVYRAISAPAALVAGLLSILLLVQSIVDRWMAASLRLCGWSCSSSRS